MSEFDSFSHFLGDLIEETKESGDEKQIAFLRGLWDNESWDRIQKKFAETQDSSRWIVWWTDGVHAYMKMASDNQEALV